MPGRKVSKKRITVALTTNSDGSHKVPLLFVGQAAKPRCFGGKSSAELGVDYTSSKKGWMTTSIFVAWLERFDAQMAEEGRHVLLLLDNASPHRVPHPMSNVTVHHLPPNTTAHLQPNDAGIIHAFKKQVANRRAAIVVDRLDRLLEREESGGEATSEHELEHLFDATVLEAMTWAQEAWEAVSSSAVANCWQHTGILDVDVFELLARMERLRVVPLS